MEPVRIQGVSPRQALKDFDQKLRQCEQKVKEAFDSFTAVHSAFYWRMPQVDGIEAKVILACGLVDQLRKDDIGELDRALKTIEDPDVLSDRMGKLQQLEKKALLLETNYRRIDALRMNNYLKGCTKIHEACQRVLAVIHGSQNLTQKVDDMAREVRWCVLSIQQDVPENPFRKIQEQAQEMVDIFTAACEQLQAMIDQCDEATRDAHNTTFSPSKESIQQLRQQLPPQQQVEVPQEAFAEYEKTHGPSWTGWALSKLGLFQLPGEDGKFLQQVHAARSKGSHDDLIKTIDLILAGDASTLLDRIAKHAHVLAALRQDLDAIRTRVGLQISLRDAVNCFTFELVEQQAMLDHIAALAKEASLAKYKAHAAFRAALSARTVFTMFTVGSQIAASSNTVQELYRKHADRALVLQGPDDILTRITRVLYLPVALHDIGELELALHGSMLPNDQESKVIIDAYKVKCTPQVLELAKAELPFIQQPFSVLHLAEAWQRVVEFSAQEQAPKYLTEFLYSKMALGPYLLSKTEEPNTAQEEGLLASINIAASEMQGDIKANKERLLESFLVRAIGAYLFARDPRIKVRYQKHVQDVLELDMYKDLKANFRATTLRLITEFTVRRPAAAGRCEKELFLAGPASRYLSEGSISDSEGLIADTLCRMIQDEEGRQKPEQIATTFFINRTGQAEFNSWYHNTYQVYLQAEMQRDNQSSAKAQKAARKVALFSAAFGAI